MTRPVTPLRVTMEKRNDAPPCSFHIHLPSASARMSHAFFLCFIFLFFTVLRSHSRSRFSFFLFFCKWNKNFCLLQVARKMYLYRFPFLFSFIVSEILGIFMREIARRQWFVLILDDEKRDSIFSFFLIVDLHKNSQSTYSYWLDDAVVRFDKIATLMQEEIARGEVLIRFACEWLKLNSIYWLYVVPLIGKMSRS